MYHRPIVVGDVLVGEGKIIDIYEKETDAATMTFVVIETVWTDASSGRPGRDRALQPHRTGSRSSGARRWDGLQDKVAIITGAGQGIGLAYAERFLAEGAKVVVAEINEERAESAMKPSSTGKGEVVFVQTDISRRDVGARLRRADRRAVRHRRHPRQQRRALLRHRQLRQQLRVPQAGVRREPARRVAHGAGRRARRWRAALGPHHQPVVGRGVHLHAWRRRTSSTSSAPSATARRSGASSGSRSSWPAQLGQYNVTVNCIAPGVTMTEATKKIVPEEFIGHDPDDERDEAHARARGPRRRRACSSRSDDAELRHRPDPRASTAACCMPA